MAYDSEDEDLKAAIALSLATHDASSQKAIAATSSLLPETLKALTGSLPLGIDRKAMEQERLARLAICKRERSISPPSRKISRTSPALAETTTTLPSGARLKTFSSLVQRDQESRKTQNANAANRRLKTEPVKKEGKMKVEDDEFDPEVLPAGAIKYPDGVIKKTWAVGHPRTRSDIKIEEVFEASSVRVAVLSAFQWDVEWVLSKLQTVRKGGRTKLVFVMQGSDEAQRTQMLKDVEEEQHYLRLCFPPMHTPIFCMHSKLMLLFHPEKLRIAVPTANLLNFDWGETGQMENNVFLIDLPRLPADTPNTIEDLPAFGQELMFFITKQGLDEEVRTGVLKFDFTATQRLAFVHTVGGTSYRDSAERTGLPGLASAIRNLDLTTTHLELDFAASSIGALNEAQLHNLQAAARGEDMIARAAGSVPPGKSKANAKAKATFFQPSSSRAPPPPNPLSALRLYFPTHPTVKASTATATGTICMQRGYWEAKTFPRSVFRDYQSTRPGLLSHNKILLARGRRTGAEVGDPDVDVAWVYVGSANMSKSAWGEVTREKNSGDFRVVGRNWECGVVVPVALPKREKGVKVKQVFETGEDAETEDEDEDDGRDTVVGLDVFRGVVDVPFQVPGAAYAGRRPWFFKEDM